MSKKLRDAIVSPYFIQIQQYLL